MELGGIADKLGNRYEAKWLVRYFIDVIAGKTNWLKFEGVGTEYDGFEFAAGVGETTQWHQTKFNAPAGNWTINALNREGVLKAFANRLSANQNDHCFFVSQDNAKDFRTLSEKARDSNSADEYLRLLSRKQLDCFHQIAAVWRQPNDIAFGWLKRSYIEFIPGRELDSLISSYGDLYFFGGGEILFPTLRDILENHFNKRITTEFAREIIRNHDHLNFKEWALDPTIPQRLVDETNVYLSTYSPFGAGGSTIERGQVTTLIDAILQDNGKDLIIVTGVAGAGKSGIVRGAIEALQKHGVPHLAFRVDQHLSCGTREALGDTLTGRHESPVSTLKGTYPSALSVLFIDQVDAVSEVSGRDGQIKEVLFRLINDAHIFGKVKAVVVCRTFDLGSDSRLKALVEKDRTISIDVPLLDWKTDVSPVLENHGFGSASFNEPQRNMLCLPVNLAVFLEIGDPSFSFKSRAGLHEKLIEKKQRDISRERHISWSVVQALGAMSEWMSARQMLSAPASVLDAYPNAIDMLTSEGLIVSSRDQINFFHESFFDHVYARSYVNGDQTLIGLLTSTEQHLFRRTQVRQILDALRQSDLPRYLKEVSSLLQRGEVRYHIKVAVAQWLNSIDTPTEQEFSILSGFNNTHGRFHRFFHDSVLSTHVWFDLLNGNGWIQNQINSTDEDRAKSVLYWLSNIAGERPTEVSLIWRNWWEKDKSRGIELLNQLSLVRRNKPDEALLLLCEDLINTHPEGLFQDNNRIMLLLDTWGEQFPEQCGRVLHAIFDAWFATHSDSTLVAADDIKELDLHSLGKMAKKAPQSLLQGMTDAMVNSVEKVIADKGNEAKWYLDHRTRSEHAFGFDALLRLYRDALKQCARIEPELAKSYLDKIQPHTCETTMHLHLETIQANPEVFSKSLLPLADDKMIFKAGYSGADWLSFAETCHAAFPFLTDKEREYVEQVILTYTPETDWALRFLKDDNNETSPPSIEERKRIIRYLNESGYGQWCILETIGETHLGTVGLARLHELRRKFPVAKIEEPHDVGMVAVQSPIEQSHCEMMSDKHWLNAIVRYDSEDERQRERTLVHGGARELARQLHHVTKNDPTRFSNLCLQIPDEANSAYIENILWGLAEAESPSTDILIQSIKRAHRHPSKGFGTEIARLIERQPQIAGDPEILGILIWYAINGEANESEDIETKNTERETVTINSLLRRGEGMLIRGINGARGRSWEALGQALWTVPEVEDEVWKALSIAWKRETLLSVRCCMVKPLAPLFNLNKERFTEAMRQLIVLPSSDSCEKGQSALSPLVTHTAVDLFPYIFHWLPDLAEELTSKLLENETENMQLIGAWHVFCESFRNEAYVEKANELASATVNHRRLLASVAAQALPWAENRPRTEALLIELFSDSDEEVRKQARSVFGYIKPEEVGNHLNLAASFLESPAFLDGQSSFMRMLKEATCDVLEIIVLAVQKITDDLLREEDRRRPHGTDLHYLQDILTHEYTSSESTPEARKIILDVIDSMLLHNMYGVDQVVTAHDRW